jgi:hypothetical protein
VLPLELAVLRELAVHQAWAVLGEELVRHQQREGQEVHQAPEGHPELVVHQREVRLELVVYQQREGPREGLLRRSDPWEGRQLGRRSDPEVPAHRAGTASCYRTP